MTTPNPRQQLRLQMESHLTLEDIRALCFDLNLNYENLSGDTVKSKVLALIGDMTRQGRLAALLEALREERPHIAWPSAASLLGQTPPEQPQPTPPPPTKGPVAEQPAVQGKVNQPTPNTTKTTPTPEPTITQSTPAKPAIDTGLPRFHDETGFCLPADDDLGFVMIPAGPFLMGSSDQDQDAGEDERPQHTVHLESFYMAKYPVTVAQFRYFLKQSNRQPTNVDCLKDPNTHPVRYVTWYEALAYTQWLNGCLLQWTGTPTWLKEQLRKSWQVTLPSEAQWEKAARGEKGNIYPWGNMFIASNANHAGTGLDTTSPVGSFHGGVSPYGLHDMVGNVWEWTRSLYDRGGVLSIFRLNVFKYPYQANDGREDLSKYNRVLRGGSFSSEPTYLRCASRAKLHPHYDYGYSGFRICVSLLL